MASAANLLTAVPVGMVIDDVILPGEAGTILLDGTSPPVNTLGTVVGAPIWLSDLPGGFRATPGTIGIIIGNVLSSSIIGSFHFGSSFPVNFS